MKIGQILLAIIVLITIGIVETVAQHSYVQSGPMLGPITLRDASIWVQTIKEASVSIAYTELKKDETYTQTIKVNTKAEDGYTTAIHLTNLKPATAYQYKVIVDNIEQKFEYPLTFTTQQHWQFRADAPDFSFVAGSCFYINDPSFDRPGQPYGGNYSIISHMIKSKPDFMVWLGDNTYLREGDFESRSGIYYRNMHTRSLKELQPFLAANPHYAIWDDHDYGPNDSDWTYPLKSHALDAFKDYWPSEAYGAGHTEGITSGFAWNDCQFFMLDNRWYRTVQKEDGSILGEQQKYWLKEALLASKASFKFVAVGGQFLSDFAGFENFANYVQERDEIIQFIDDNNIKNVVFLSGDRHHSEISKMTTSKGNTIYDVTSSAITSTTYDHGNEPNTLRVPGSMVSERNFAVFNVTGSQMDRKLEVYFKNALGQEVYRYKFE